jgi:PleD family two-component response regulator
MEGSNRGEGRNRPENIEIVKKYIEKGHPLKSARSLTALEYWHASRMEKAKARIETLEEHAYHDKLTGLANRRVLDERLKEVFALARRQKINLSVFMIDLDNFTAYNREYGHA